MVTLREEAKETGKPDSLNEGTHKKESISKCWVVFIHGTGKNYEILSDGRTVAPKRDIEYDMEVKDGGRSHST